MNHAPNMKRFQFSLQRYWFLHISYLVASLKIAISFLVCTPFSQNFSYAQEAQETPGSAVVRSDANAVKRVHGDYDAYMAKRTGFEATYTRIGKVFEETEVDLTSIRNTELQQQMALSNLAFQQMNITDPGPITSLRPGSRANLDRNMAQNNRARIDIEAAMRSEQLRQLSTTQQAVFRRRLEAARDLETLRNDVSVWQQKWTALFNPYWQFTDPEGIRTIAQNQEVLEALKGRAENNVPALLAQGLVEFRLGQTTEAIKTLDEVIRLNTQLNPIALAARSLAHASKNDKQKAKVDVQKAIGAEPKNPYVKWLRASLTASQGDFATSKKELGNLVSIQEHETAARRFLAVLIALRPAKGKKDPADALDHAQMAADLSGQQNWYSELVLSMALHVSGKSEEAIAKAEHAKELATGEMVVRCENVIAWIKTDEPLDWKFVP